MVGYFPQCSCFHLGGAVSRYQVLPDATAGAEALLRIESLQRQEAFKLAQVEADARNAQLALLRYQLNPHFLFNTLNSVNALVSKGDAGKSDEDD